MKTPKLSDRAQLLLWFVHHNTERNWITGKLGRFFVPFADAYYYRGNDGLLTFTYISGSGDIASLRKLERLGLIERPETSIRSKYIYALTGAGLKVVTRLGLDERFE